MYGCMSVAQNWGYPYGDIGAWSGWMDVWMYVAQTWGYPYVDIGAWFVWMDVWMYVCSPDLGVPIRG